MSQSFADLGVSQPVVRALAARGIENPFAVQRVLGISAEPVLTAPGEEGMLEASRDAGLLVVGLSTRWHREGLVSSNRSACIPVPCARR